MNYIMVCNVCKTQFECKHARYLCDDCRKRENGDKTRAQIELLLKENKYKGHDIAKKFNVTPSYVSKIKKEIGLIKGYEELL